MTKDWKKLFAELLYEEDDDGGEVVEEGKLENVYETPKPSKKTAAVTSEEKTVDQETEVPKKKSSYLIDVEEPKGGSQMVHVGKSFETKKDEEYESQPTISPIFGVVGNVEKKVVKEAVKVEEKLIKKPESSYLGTVISPIYGYGSKEDDTRAMKIQEEMDAEKEIHEMIRERDEMFQEVTIDEILSSSQDDDLAEQELSLFDQIFSSEDK